MPTVVEYKHTLGTILLLTLTLWHFYTTGAWQKATTQVLKGSIFIDDILITGHTHQEYEANLRQVLSKLQ